MTTPPRVTVIVVSFNTRDDTLRCLRSIEAHCTLPVEVIVADNDSRDGSVAAIRGQLPKAVVLEMRTNLGFAAANNRALERASAPLVLFLNSDAEIRPGAVERLAQALDAAPEAALAGPRTLNSDETVQLSWGPHLTPLAEWRQRRWVRGLSARNPRIVGLIDDLSRREHRPAWVSGSCMLARLSALRAVCGFDDGYFLYEEDADLCARLRAKGWDVLFVPGAEIIHHGGRSARATGTRARIEYHRSHLRYYRRHNGWAALALLRGMLMTRAGLTWLLSFSGGPGATDARRTARTLWHEALRGAPRARPD